MEGSATVYHGAREDVPVPADWDGNGVLDHIVWRPAHGGWYVRGVGTFYFGARGDVPVRGDYDADPQLDLAVYRNGAWYIEGSATVFHGLAGDCRCRRTGTLSMTAGGRVQRLPVSLLHT